jgi:hypothetical protein
MDRKPIQFRTDQKGLDVDPTNGAIIKGNDGYTPLTFKNQIDPTYILSPTGLVSYAMPGQEHTVIPGNMAAEIPANTLGTFNYSNTNKMNTMQYAQAGGGASAEQQQQQIIQMVAQGLQQGADPKQIMQQLVKMGMPIKQAQKIVMAVAQQMQSEQQEAQAGQQDQEDQADQEQEMQGQEQGQGMMEEGGEPCFDCYDHYNPSPQAQDLNWYYKATGGNTGYMMDDLYETGGEAFPQAQTYLPYDRAGETRPNFMFETGGQSDIHRLYQKLKAGGMDHNPKKKKGAKFSGVDEFAKYLNGGSLPKAQLGPPTYDPTVTDYLGEFSNTPAQDAQEMQDLQAFDKQQGRGFDFGSNTMVPANSFSSVSDQGGIADQMMPDYDQHTTNTIPGTLYPYTKKGMRNANRWERRTQRNPEYALTHMPEYNAPRGNNSSNANQPPANNQNPNQPTNQNPNNPTNNNPSNPSNPNAPSQGSSTNNNYSNPGNNNNNNQGNNNWMQNAGVDPRSIIAANQAGNLVTQLAGNKVGAALGLLGMAGNAATGFMGLGRDKAKINTGAPGGGRWDEKYKGLPADIFAAGRFGLFGLGAQGQGNQGQNTQFTGIQNDPMYKNIQAANNNATTTASYNTQSQPTDNTFNQGNLNLAPSNNLSNQGGMGMWKEGGDLSTYRFGDTTGDFKFVGHGPMFSNMGKTINTASFVSGVDRGMTLNNQRADYANLQNNSNTITNGLGYTGAAGKTPTKNGVPSPVGTTNYMGMNAYSPGNQNFGYNNFASQYLNYSKMGGSILDHYEDGSEVDLSDLSPEDQDAFIQRIIQAGGSVEYI